MVARINKRTPGEISIDVSIKERMLSNSRHQKMHATFMSFGTKYLQFDAIIKSQLL